MGLCSTQLVILQELAKSALAMTCLCWCFGERSFTLIRRGRGGAELAVTARGEDAR